MFSQEINDEGEHVQEESVVNCMSLKCESEVEHIAIQLDDIYLGVIILNAIRSAIRTTVF